MDSITQGILGAAIGQKILGGQHKMTAPIVGALIATIPDLDVILYLFYDSYEMLDIHRGFSHSILFNLIISFLLASILSRIKWFSGTSFIKLYWYSWMCLFTHILLDCFTTYGTQILLPFSHYRLSLDSINVVDPLFTIPMLLGLVLNIRRPVSRWRGLDYNDLGLLISSFFLIFTLFNKEYMNVKSHEILSSSGTEIEDILTVPVGVGNMKWYGVGKGRDSIYLLENLTYWSRNKEVISFPTNNSYLDKLDPEIAYKMRWFAKDFYTVAKKGDKIRVYNLQVDMRGVTEEDGVIAPTHGFFEIYKKNGEYKVTTGSIHKLEK